MNDINPSPARPDFPATAPAELRDDPVLSARVASIVADLPLEGACAQAQRNTLNALDRVQQEHPVMFALKRMSFPGVRWPAVAAALALAVLIGVLMSGGPSSRGYAAVVERLHEASTLSLKMKITNMPSMPEIDATVLRKEPGLTRMTMAIGGGAESTAILNASEGKLLSISPATRQAIVMELGAWKQDPQNEVFLSRLEDLKTLPARADEAMFGDLEGRRMRIYLLKDAATEKYVWIDDATGQLTRMTIEYPGDANRPRCEMYDFRIDEPIDDALFSTAVPAGYDDATAMAAPAALGASGESNLVDALKVNVDALGAFPAVLDPSRPFDTSQALTDGLKASMLKRVQAGEKFDDRQAVQKMAIQQGIKYAMLNVFLSQMKPANDFHYAGASLKPGNAADWIAWWRPDGAATYRVIRGDLTVADESAEAAAAH